jgi:hypothetical protein
MAERVLSGIAMLRNALLTGLVFGASLFSQAPTVIHDDEDAEQAGAVRFQGVTEADEVRVDGELVNARGLARSGYLLLLAPGDYVVSVRNASTGKICSSRVTVAEAETTTPLCSWERARVAPRE